MRPVIDTHFRYDRLKVGDYFKVRKNGLWMSFVDRIDIPFNRLLKVSGFITEVIETPYVYREHVYMTCVDRDGNKYVVRHYPFFVDKYDWI